MFSVVIVDDEIEICEMLRDFLETRGHKARTAQSGEEALRIIDEEMPDMVLLDYNMPGMDGEVTLKEIKNRYQDLPVIMVTINSDRKKLLDLIKKGALDFISKPIYINDLEHCLSMQELSLGKKSL